MLTLTTLHIFPKDLLTTYSKSYVFVIDKQFERWTKKILDLECHQ